MRRLKTAAEINLPSLSKARLKGLIKEAVVDAYTEEEQIVGFLTMIEEHLVLPFSVKMLGVEAEVEKVDLTLDSQIVVICRRGNMRQKVPILDLPLPVPAPAGAEWMLVKGLRRVGAKDLESANAYLGIVFVALWNRRFTAEPQMAGDAHRGLLSGRNLGSVLSIRESRTVAADYTVRWAGTIYRVQREHIARGMSGARVQLERRLDGSPWMQWQNRFVPLERCAARPRVIVERVVKRGATAERSPQEKARAKQRLLAARRRLSQAYAQLPDRPIWQAMNSRLPSGELR